MGEGQASDWVNTSLTELGINMLNMAKNAALDGAHISMSLVPSQK